MKLNNTQARKILRIHGEQGLNNIVSVKVTKPMFGKTITIHIETHNPGILIGKQGIHINMLKEWFSALMGTPVEINIIESRMFSLSEMK